MRYLSEEVLVVVYSCVFGYGKKHSSKIKKLCSCFVGNDSGVCVCSIDCSLCRVQEFYCILKGSKSMNHLASKFSL